MQANKYAYCIPRETRTDNWSTYRMVEVGFIKKPMGKDFTPPSSWRSYADHGWPSDVYGYVPTQLVLDFITAHGGESAS